jgi:hypothetical protein
MDAIRFIELAKTHAAAGYDSAQSVRLANSAAGELRTMALAALASPQETDQLISLLSHPLAGSWVVYVALENGNLSEFQRSRCLAIVQALARGNSITGMGAKAWLTQHGYEA